MDGADEITVAPETRDRRHVWHQVALQPLHSLWDLKGMPISVLGKRTFNAIMDDNLLGRAAELGYYFLFALFPTLVSASTILGLAAKSATDIYDTLLHYFALILPPSAYGIVLETFNKTTAASSSGKLTLGLAAAIWASSVGCTSIQDALNTVYNVKETRPYWKVRGSAILLTLVLSFNITLILACLLGGDFLALLARHHLVQTQMLFTAVLLARIAGGLAAALLLILLFSIIYYWGPNIPNKRWHWFTPGAAVAIVFWFVSSISFRIYLHYFNTYSVTYGSLGAVIILLLWFYISGLMLLIGAEVNSEIEAYAAEQRLAAAARKPQVDAAAPMRGKIAILG